LAQLKLASFVSLSRESALSDTSLRFCELHTFTKSEFRSFGLFAQVHPLSHPPSLMSTSRSSERTAFGIPLYAALTPATKSYSFATNALSK
jgi:hypothetical protein